MDPQWPLILFTFFVCASGGVFAMQGLLCVLGEGRKTQLPSLAVSLIALVVGGIAVFLHLQHWERIFNGFGHITSGITLEFIGCIVFFAVLALYFLMMRRSESGVAPKWCGVLAIVVGIGLPIVTGDSYLMSAIPAWNTLLLPVYYAVNAVFMGALAMLVICGIVDAREAKAEVSDGGLALEASASAKAALGAGIVQAAIVVIYAARIALSGDAYSSIEFYFDPTLPDVGMVDVGSTTSALLSGSLAPLFYGGVLAVGVLVALAAVVAMRKKHACGSALAAYGAVGLACAMVGGICWRYALYVVAMSVFALY